jgi:trehalose synthase
MATTRRRLQEGTVQALDPARLEPLIGDERMQRFEDAAERARALVGRRSILNINSTATGGGVAEMLQTLRRGSRAIDEAVAPHATHGLERAYRP